METAGQAQRPTGRFLVGRFLVDRLPVRRSSYRGREHALKNTTLATRRELQGAHPAVAGTPAPDGLTRRPTAAALRALPTTNRERLIRGGPVTYRS